MNEYRYYNCKINSYTYDNTNTVIFKCTYSAGSGLLFRTRDVDIIFYDVKRIQGIKGCKSRIIETINSKLIDNSYCYVIRFQDQVDDIVITCSRMSDTFVE